MNLMPNVIYKQWISFPLLFIYKSNLIQIYFKFVSLSHTHREWASYKIHKP